MKLFLFPVQKDNEDAPDFKVMQRQRLPKDSEKTYQEIEVGAGWKGMTPQGVEYITVKVEGFSDNAPCKCNTITI